MTVGELIEILRAFPPDDDVVVWDAGEGEDVQPCPRHFTPAQLRGMFNPAPKKKGLVVLNDEPIVGDA